MSPDAFRFFEDGFLMSGPSSWININSVYNLDVNCCPAKAFQRPMRPLRVARTGGDPSKKENGFHDF